MNLSEKDLSTQKANDTERKAIVGDPLVLAQADARKKSEAQLLEDVFVAANALCCGQDWNNGAQAKKHGWRQKLIAAVDAVAAHRDAARYRSRAPEAEAQP